MTCSSPSSVNNAPTETAIAPAITTTAPTTRANSPTTIFGSVWLAGPPFSFPLLPSHSPSPHFRGGALGLTDPALGREGCPWPSLGNVNIVRVCVKAEQHNNTNNTNTTQNNTTQHTTPHNTQKTQKKHTTTHNNTQKHTKTHTKISPSIGRCPVQGNAQGGGWEFRV